MLSRRVLIGLLAAVAAAPAGAQVVGNRPSFRPDAPLTLQLLNRRIPEIRYEQVPFETVMQSLQELTEINMSVRWETLEAAGVEREAPITIQARNLRLSQILWMVLNAASQGDTPLAYRMSGKLLILSTELDLGREQITKVYDVSDLMVRIENAERPQFQQSQGLGQSTSGGSLFQNQQQQQRRQQNQDDPTVVQPEMERLIRVITRTIEPDSWDTNDSGETSANLGRIEAYGNLLIVTNTILVHQRLGGYLTE